MVRAEGALEVTEALARQFHETYERLAPEFSYETRKASAVPWEDVPENNKRLMVAVAAEILAARPEPPVEGALEVALSAALYAAPTHGPMCDRDGDGDDCRCWMGQGRAALAAVRSGHDGLRALEAMREAGLRPTIYICGPGAAKPWACGWAYTDDRGRHVSGHELGATPLEAAETAAARALSPDPAHKPDRSPR